MTNYLILFFLSVCAPLIFYKRQDGVIPICFLDEFFEQYRAFLPLTKKNRLAIFAYVCWKWKACKIDFINLVLYLVFLLFMSFLVFRVGIKTESRVLFFAICTGVPLAFASVLFFVGRIAQAHWTFGREVRRKRKERAGLGLDASDKVVFEELASKSKFEFGNEEINKNTSKTGRKSAVYKFVKSFLFVLCMSFVMIFAFLIEMSKRSHMAEKRSGYNYEEFCIRNEKCKTQRQNFLNNTNTTKNATNEPQN